MSHAKHAKHENGPYLSDGPRRAKVDTPELHAGARMARKNPGEWVMAFEFAEPPHAQMVGHQLRTKYPDLEISTSKGKVFMRTPAVETK